VSLELGRVTDRKPPFKYSALERVRFSDTDAQGVVYYGRYMPYFDLARVEYHRHLDMFSPQRREHEFVMRAATVEYLAPARFDDLIEIFVRISRIGRTSVTYEFAAYRVENDVLMVTAHQTLVLVEIATHRAVPVPDFFRDAIRSFEGEDLEA
jgi:acyl-CoA thioester hydrolase